MSKNTRFIISSIILSAGFFSVSYLESQDRLLGIVVLSVLTAVMVAWSIFEAIGFNFTLVTLLLPSLYTLGVGLFWFLLPSTLLATLPIIVLYGVGVFGLLKTMNIFAVSTYKKIALSRAAKGVGFVLTLFTGFLLYDAILSLRSELYILVPVVYLAAYPLFLVGLWTSELGREVNKDLFLYSAIFSFGVAATSALLFFWPVTVIEGSLFLTVAMYVLLGLGQARFEGRLFKATVREYLIVGFLVFSFMVATTSWR